MIAFLIGLFIWTLLEYLLHRFIFHRFKGIVGSFHHEHHVAPRDLRFLFVRPSFALAASILLFAVAWGISRSAWVAFQVMMGIWAGYAYYESVHYRVHFTAAEGGWIGRQRRAHFRHHFRDNRRCFGVTTPLWDWVFGTTSSD